MVQQVADIITDVTFKICLLAVINCKTKPARQVPRTEMLLIITVDTDQINLFFKQSADIMNYIFQGIGSCLAAFFKG